MPEEGFTNKKCAAKFAVSEEKRNFAAQLCKKTIN